MRKYEGIKHEYRWLFDEVTHMPRKEIRYGVMYVTRRFKRDLFHWFDIKTTEWGCWVKAPDSLGREIK